MGVKSCIREPQSVVAATKLCERLAGIEGDLELINTARQADIAAINARADTPANELIAERDLIAEKLEPWFLKSGKDLLKGKAKSVELGGAMLGTRKSRAVLDQLGDADELVAKLKALRWAKAYINTTVSIDRSAVLKALDGKKHGVKLAELGFSEGGGDETFFVKRAEQGGTRS